MSHSKRILMPVLALLLAVVPLLGRAGLEARRAHATSLAVTLPLMFRFGVEKGRALMIFIVVAGAISSASAMERIHLSTNFPSFLQIA